MQHLFLVAGLRLERRTPAYETGDLANLSTPQQSLHQPRATVKPQMQQNAAPTVLLGDAAPS